MSQPAAHPAPPPGIASTVDYETYVRGRLDPAVWHYLDEGGPLTQAANRRAFDALPLMPRPLSCVAGGHTQMTLFGQALQHPILLAPIAYQRLFHPDGEMASAMAAAAQGGSMVVSSLASQPVENIAQASLETGAAPWFQLYWQGERERTLRLARRAEAAGYVVTMFTADAPVKLAGLPLPGDIRAVNLEQPLAAAPIGPGQSQVFDAWMTQAPTWDDLAWLREHLRLPLLVKGLLHPEDAARAVALGCDGLVVSNHGGRVLDGSPASLDALPSVLARVGGQVPVLLDSGIRDGRDVFKALSLGASAVLLGRPYIWGLAGAGALGVAHVIRLLRDELEMAMALCGCSRLETIPVRSAP